MEQGYVLDQAHGAVRLPQWVAGEPQYSWLRSLKLWGKEKLDVATYRCRRCGYLESYA
jgi:hypothetical protein